MYCWSLYKL